jgi:hypothetical protein
MTPEEKARELVNAREVWRIAEIRIPEMEALIAAAIREAVAEKEAEIKRLREALTQSEAAMLETRAASVAGSEQGYGKPELWAERLFKSHWALTRAIEAARALLRGET